MTILTVADLSKSFDGVEAVSGVSFTLAAPETLPWSADALAVEQVLSNLISNPLRHTPPSTDQSPPAS